jgi:uroporphyrinogen decarboxylase
MMTHSTAWHHLMGMLADLVGNYLLAQARAGANALQIFDSWVGVLSPADYAKHVLPYTQRAVQIARQGGVPIIHFGTDTAGILDLMAATGADIIGVDWRIDLGKAWAQIGYDKPVQGNLDPIALFAPWKELCQRAQDVLDQAKGRTGHIFNLGHGILPETPIENVKRLVDFVHDYTNR